ncbi:MAG: hypothetical protein ACYDEA_07970, partial [Candidatus Dormibacteria bacterium]
MAAPAADWHATVPPRGRDGPTATAGRVLPAASHIPGQRLWITGASAKRHRLSAGYSPTGPRPTSQPHLQPR